MDDHLRDLDEFLRDFAGKSELTSALSTVRTAGGGDVHVHEAASGRDGRRSRAGRGRREGGAPSSALDAPIGRVGPAGAHPSAAATSSAPRPPGRRRRRIRGGGREDGDEDGARRTRRRWSATERRPRDSGPGWGPGARAIESRKEGILPVE